MSRRHDSPIHAIPKLPRLPPTSNNVPPEYANEFGPPTWVSSPELASFEACPEELYEARTFSTVSAIASSSPAAGHQAISWSQLQSECDKCPEYQDLVTAVLTSDRTLLINRT